MKQLRKLFGGDLRQFGMLFTLVALIAFFQILTNGLVLTPTNLMNLFNGNSYILILSIGMVLVIIAGHIDLSVGSVAALVGIIVAIAMRDWHLPWYAAILLGILIGALIGVWQGFWMAVVGIPGFIVTLAGMLLFRGANQFVGKSDTVPVPKDFQFIGAGYLPEIGPDTGYNNLTVLLGLVAIALLSWGRCVPRSSPRSTPRFPDVGHDHPHRRAGAGAARDLPVRDRTPRRHSPSGLILVALVILYTFIADRTVIGRHIYAVGGNRNAAELSGVRSQRVYFLVMMNMAVLSHWPA